MGKFSPAMANKSKWILKTSKAVEEDCNRHEGIPVGYAVAFFNPFEKDPDKVWTFAIRLGHSREHMDEGQRERLEASLRYIMLGVQKIFNVDAEELKQTLEEECVRDYEVRGTFH
jgi:hypothetical protein